MAATTKLRIRRRRPSVRRRSNPFLDGIASIFDFTGSLRRHTRNSYRPEAANHNGLGSEWVAVGDAFRSVMGDWEHFEPIKDKSKRGGMKTDA